MASTSVPDSRHQAVLDDKQTNISAAETGCHQLSSILDEFEQWATIVPNLSLDQRQEISEHLQEQISQLATYSEPNGTRKRQFIDLERLAKLQQGPLGKLVDYGGFLVIMDDNIRKRLQALSSAAVEDGSEVLDSTASSQILTPASSVGTELGSPSGSQLSNKDLESDGTLSLEHADDDVDLMVADSNISAQSSTPSSGIKDQHKKSATGSKMDCFCKNLKTLYPLASATWKTDDGHFSTGDYLHVGDVSLTIDGPDVMILSEIHHPDVAFSREDVDTVQYDREGGVIDVTLFSDGAWCLAFERREDAKAALFALACSDFHGAEAGRN